MIAWKLALCLALLLAIVSRGDAHTYFNASEPGCDGSDPDTLHCDDFEDGAWFTTTADKGNAANDGWNATPYGRSDPQGTNFGRCGGKGAAGTNCAASSGPHEGIGQAAAMADHDFNGLAEVDEVYFRYYVKPLTGYLFGQEKALTFNPCCAGIGGIKFGTMFFGLSTSTPSATPSFLVPAMDANLYQNQTGLALAGGNWYYIEVHVKLNTPGVNNGVLEMWMDNCGTDGRGCTGSGTLRMRHTTVKFRNAGDNTRIGSIWVENWANPAAVGEMYYDQIRASRRRVGPMGSSGGTADNTAPSVPGALAIR